MFEWNYFLFAAVAGVIVGEMLTMAVFWRRVKKEGYIDEAR